MAVTLARRHAGGPLLGRRRRPPLMEKFVIEGGVPLSGTMTPAGNKNAALPILAACVLTSEPVLLENVPRIRDVDTMLALLRHLGGDADWVGPNDVRVHVAEVTTHELDEELCLAAVLWTKSSAAEHEHHGMGTLQL